MIVKSKGKAVPETRNVFATIETFRENVDGKYWFPSFSTSDDELVLKADRQSKMRIRVRYKDYRVGRTDVKIIDDEDAEPTPTPSPGAQEAALALGHVNINFGPCVFVSSVRH